jgi:phosphoesterase RecJ-like protein
MFSNKLGNIFKKIKKYNTIVIARHVGADPDALASQIALRDVIINTFPKKKVYAVGYPASKFKYLGLLDKFSEEMYEKSLLIVLDTPNLNRVDGCDSKRFEDSIKIDHHPHVEQFCKLEHVDDTASSVSQMIIELIFNTPLKMTKEAAEKLYIGIVADTNRFLFYYTTPKTFDLVSELIRRTNIDFTSLYEAFYLRTIKELKFQGYIADNLTFTHNGVGYINITDDVLAQYNVDAATARNMVANFNYIEELLVWVIFTYDKTNQLIKGSIRSRGPIIKDIAESHQGGGHLYASGVRLNSEEEIDQMVEELDNACLKYKEIDA